MYLYVEKNNCWNEKISIRHYFNPDVLENIYHNDIIIFKIYSKCTRYDPPKYVNKALKCDR